MKTNPSIKLMTFENTLSPLSTLTLNQHNPASGMGARLIKLAPVFSTVLRQTEVNLSAEKDAVAGLQRELEASKKKASDNFYFKEK